MRRVYLYTGSWRARASWAFLYLELDDGSSVSLELDGGVERHGARWTQRLFERFEAGECFGWVRVPA